MLFFGSRCERLCMIQFALISLIPGLIRSLQDCADPALDQYSQTASQATSLKTSERSSRAFLPASHFETRLMLASTRLHGPASANLWKGMLPIILADFFRIDQTLRGASLGRIHHYSSWTVWLIMEPNLTLLARQIPSCSSKKTNTATYSSTLMKPPSTSHQHHYGPLCRCHQRTAAGLTF